MKLSDGMKAESFDKDTKFYIDPYKLLPMERFLPQPKGAKSELVFGRVLSVVLDRDGIEDIFVNLMALLLPLQLVDVAVDGDEVSLSQIPALLRHCYADACFVEAG